MFVFKRLRNTYTIMENTYYTQLLILQYSKYYKTIQIKESQIYKTQSWYFKE